MRWLFLGGEIAPCQDAADASDDGVIAIGDPIWSLRFQFLDGIPLPPPFPGCGRESTLDELTGDNSPGCLQGI